MTQKRTTQGIDDQPPERESSRSEMVGVYRNRSYVPPELWIDPVRLAKRSIAVRVYAGLPFFETTAGLLRHLRSRADDGVEVRLLLGDPDSDAVAVRGREEKVDMAARVRHVLHFLAPVVEYPGIGIRLDTTTLYFSLYVFDDVMIVNPHMGGVPASMSPHLHLCRTRSNRIFDEYVNDFETLCSRAAPFQG